MLDPQSIAAAAEARRRELPLSVALIVLTGGVGAAVLENSAAVAWAGVVSALLFVDAEIYRRLERREPAALEASFAMLAAWSAATSCVFAILPGLLVLDGASAAVAAAMVLLIAGFVRLCGPGASGGAGVAIAGGAPLALSLLAFPLLFMLAGRPDWDASLVAVLGGGALMAYVAHARLRQDSEVSLRLAELGEEMAARAAIHLETIAALNATQAEAAQRDRELRKSA